MTSTAILVSPHVGDIGTLFEAQIRNEQNAIVDISSATTLQMNFQKPDGTIASQTATLSTDGKDGKMRYVTILNDLDQPGKWQVQAYVVLSSGSWHSAVTPFKVDPNLPQQ